MRQHYLLPLLMIPFITLMAGAQSGDIVWIKGGQQEGICAVATSYDIRGRIFTAGNDGTIRIWNDRAMTLDTILARDVGVTIAMEASPDNTMLAAGGEEGWLRVWDLASRKLLRSFGPFPHRVLAVRFAELERQLVYGLSDGSLHALSLDTWSEVDALPPLREPAAAMDLNLWGSQSIVASAVSDSIWIRDFRSRITYGLRSVWRGEKPLLAYPSGDSIFIYATEPSPGSYGIGLASIRRPGVKVDQIDLGSWRPLWITFSSSDLGIYVMADSAGTVEFRSWSRDGALHHHSSIPFSKGAVTISGLIHPYNSYVIVGGSESRYYGGIPVENEYPLLEALELFGGVSRGGLIAHRDGVRGLEFLDSTDRLVSGAGDPELKMWDLATGAMADSVRYGGPMLAMHLSPGGDHILVNIQNDERAEGNGVWLHNVREGGERRLQEIWPNLVSPRGAYTARVDSMGPVRLAETASGNVVQIGPQKFNRLGRFSRDGNWLAWYNDDGLIRFCNLSARTITDSLGSVPRGTVLAISDDGGRVALATADGYIEVWQRQGGTLLSAFPAHAGAVHGLAFSPGGTYLVSAGEDGLVKIWEAAYGVNSYTYADYRIPYLSVAVSPDAKHIASGGADGSVVLWRVRGAMASVVERPRASAGMVHASPNPSSGTIGITITPRHSGPVSLSILTATGEEAATLLDAHLEPGEKKLTWDASGFPAGIYFCRVLTEYEVETIPVVVMK